MEVFTFKIGDTEFEFLGLTFYVASLFEQIANELRAMVIAGTDNENVTVDADFIENYFTPEHWRTIFNACLEVKNPVMKDKMDENGQVIGKYLENFLSFESFKKMPTNVSSELKKNLLKDLDYASIQKKPLTLQVKYMRELFDQLQKSQK